MRKNVCVCVCAHARTLCVCSAKKKKLGGLFNYSIANVFKTHISRNAGKALHWYLYKMKKLGNEPRLFAFP